MLFVYFLTIHKIVNIYWYRCLFVCLCLSAETRVVLFINTISISSWCLYMCYVQHNAISVYYRLLPLLCVCELHPFCPFRLLFYFLFTHVHTPHLPPSAAYTFRRFPLSPAHTSTAFTTFNHQTHIHKHKIENWYALVTTTILSTQQCSSLYFSCSISYITYIVIGWTLAYNLFHCYWLLVIVFIKWSYRQMW